VDAYCNYIMRVSEARVDQLRREAQVERMARVARARRGSRLQQLRSRFQRRRSAGVVAPPVRLPSAVAAEAELRRSA